MLTSNDFGYPEIISSGIQISGVEDPLNYINHKYDKDMNDEIWTKFTDCGNARILGGYGVYGPSSVFKFSF